MNRTTTSTLILASSSPRRQELIRIFNLPYEVIVSDADETIEGTIPPSEVVETLALRKASVVLEKAAAVHKAGIIIGCDTIVVLDGEVLGKPKNEEDAFRTLKRLQGRTHQVFSGVACLDIRTSSRKCGHPETMVTIQPLTDTQIPRYIASGEPMDKAGGNDITMYLGDTGQYRILSESPIDQPEVIVGHTVSKVTFGPMSDEEIEAYVETGDPLDKAGAYGVQGLGSVFVERIEGDFYSIMGLPLNLLYQMLLKFGVSPFKE